MSILNYQYDRVPKSSDFESQIFIQEKGYIWHIEGPFLWGLLFLIFFNTRFASGVLKPGHNNHFIIYFLS